IVLSFAGIWCLWRYVRHRRRATLWLAGICTGLTFLTKPEVFAALAVAMLAPLPLVIRTELPERRRFFILFAIVAGGVIPIVVAAGLFSVALSPRDAIAALFESWRPLLNPTLRRELSTLPFYRAVTGTGNIFLSLGQTSLWVGVYATLLGYAYWKALQSPGKLERRFSVSVAVVVCAGAVLLARYWPEQARPLPLFASLWLASVIPSVWRTRDQHETSLAVLQVAWATFGTA